MRAIILLAVLALACGRSDHRFPAESTITVLLDGDERALGPAADDAPKFVMFLPMWGINDQGEVVGRLAER